MENSANKITFNAALAREDNIIGKKISKERDVRQMSLSELCAELDKYGVKVLRGAISKWEQGTTCPNPYQLLALCSVFGIDDFVSYFTDPNVLSKEGRRKLLERQATEKSTQKRRTPDVVYVSMPVSLLAASAGTGSFLDDDNFEKIDFPENVVPVGADFGIMVCGDSMEPSYSDGQIVWVKKCSSLRNGEVGIFTFDGSGYIKMYSEREPENKEEYTDSLGVLHMQPVLISYNSKYSPIVVSPEKEFSIVGKVL